MVHVSAVHSAIGNCRRDNFHNMKQKEKVQEEKVGRQTSIGFFLESEKVFPTFMRLSRGELLTPVFVPIPQFRGIHGSNVYSTSLTHIWERLFGKSASCNTWQGN